MNCLNCGKTFSRIRQEFGKSKIGEIFCCSSCASFYFRSNKGGDSRTKAKRVYKQKCAVCGCEDPDVLEVHHIDKNRKNNDVDNLIFLCANHHAKVHRGGLEITQDIKNKREIIT